MASLGQAARHLFLSERRLKELVDQGVIARSARSAYDLDRVREAYIRHVREAAAGRAQTGELDPAQERARKDKELADKTAMENDLTRGAVVRVEDVARLVARQFGVVRSRILAAPAKIAAGMPSDLRQKAFSLAENEVQEALSDLSSDAIVEDAKATARRGRK